MPGTPRELPLREPTAVVVEPPRPVDTPAAPAPTEEPPTAVDTALSPAKAETAAAPAEKETDYSSLEDEMARLLDELAGDLKSDKPA